MKWAEKINKAHKGKNKRPRQNMYKRSRRKQPTAGAYLKQNSSDIEETKSLDCYLRIPLRKTVFS
jgi:hypothetical protein